MMSTLMHHLWRQARQPSKSLPPEARRRAAFAYDLQRVLLAINVLLILAMSVGLIRGQYVTLAQAIPLLIFLPFQYTMLLLTRSAAYWLATACTVVGYLLTIAAIAVFFPTPIGSSAAFYYFTLPLVTTALLARRVYVLWVAIGSILLMFVVLALNEQARSTWNAPPGLFLLVMTALILVFVRYRDRLEAERRAELTQKEELFRNLVEQSNDIVATLDVHGIFTYISPSITRLTGYLERELLGQPFGKLLDERWAEILRREYTQQMRMGALESQRTFPIRTRSGTACWVEQTVKLVYHDEIFSHFFMVAHDITDRKLAEETLLLTQFSLDSARDSAFWLTPEGGLAYANRAACTSLGYSYDDLLNLSVQDVFPEINAGRWQELWDRLTSDSSLHIETQARRKSGRTSLVDIAATYLNYNEREYIFAFARDISVRKQMESEMQQQRDFALQVMETMGQGLTITDAYGRFQYVNPAYGRLIGLPPAALLGRRPMDVTVFEDVPALEEHRQARGQGEISTYESRLIRSDGELVYVLITGVPRFLDGQFNGSIAVITDLTAQKHIESALAEARDQALAAAQLKSEFLAVMSHEIRTPLTGIIGMSEVLQDTPLDENQQEYVSTVLGEANSLLTIINDILDFSKIEAGKMLIDSTEFVVQDVVERVVEFMNPRRSSKPVVLLSSVDPHIPLTLKGDPTRLRQILINLVSNALKFTARGEVLVRVSIEAQDAESLTLRFAVHDSGIGLSEAARSRLFTPFTQADRGTTRKYGGTGLGLAICKRLTELMGGEIGVESQEGKGSTFWFSVPFDRVEQPQGAAAMHLAGCNALVISPRQTQRQVLLDYLTAWDAQAHAVETVTEGAEVMRACAAHGQTCDVVVLDLEGDIDVQAALAQFRSAIPGFHAQLLLLANAAAERRQIAEWGTAVLPKPLRQAAFFEAVHDLLQRQPPGSAAGFGKPT